jgi:hypothetical protein
MHLPHARKINSAGHSRHSGSIRTTPCDAQYLGEYREIIVQLSISKLGAIEVKECQFSVFFRIGFWFSQPLSATRHRIGPLIMHPDTTHQALSRDMSHFVLTPSIPDLDERCETETSSPRHSEARLRPHACNSYVPKESTDTIAGSRAHILVVLGRRISS